MPYMEEEDHQDVSQIQDAHEHEPSGNGDDEVFTWSKARAPRELVGSIQRRFQHDNRAPRPTNKAIRKSNSFDEKLAKLVPEFESLPLKTREDCSLDRYRMKQILPFAQIATMCPPMTSVGDKFPDELNAAITCSTHVRKLGYRKMSAPVIGTDLFSLHLQDSNLAEEDRNEGDDEQSNTFPGEESKNGSPSKQFRSRTRAIRLTEGERRNRRLTEPIMYQTRADNM